MFDVYSLTLLLLPLAAASGWLMARRSQSTPDESRSVNPDYLKGLNYLVNEDPDKAIEVFVRLIEVDNDTVETHLALGNLFRRRGEVDRALRIHQNLVARPNLKAMHREQARFELARDYLRAGVLDRAETLFQDLVAEGVSLQASLEHLITIYEKERDWHRAIETARRLESIRGQPQRIAIAHYWCELTQESMRRDDRREARRLVRRALSEDRDCVRASLLRGQAHEQAEDHRAAIKAYSRVMRQDNDFLTEVLEPLERCYRALDATDEWREFLEEAGRHYAGVAPQVAVARLLDGAGRGDAATGHLAAYLEHSPSWLGFYHLLELTRAHSEGGLNGPLSSLRESLRHLIETTARYRCTQCGFGGRTLHWQCPRCSHWSSVRPLKDLRPC